MQESVKTVETKQEAAPIDLPETIYEEEQVAKTIENEKSRKDESVKAEPPGNLPVWNIKTRKQPVENYNRWLMLIPWIYADNLLLITQAFNTS